MIKNKGRTRHVAMFFALVLFAAAACFAPAGEAGEGDWDGNWENADFSWLTDNPSRSEYTINTARQLAGLAAIMDRTNEVGTEYRSLVEAGFPEKTIYLGADIDLTAYPDVSWRAMGDITLYNVYVQGNSFKGIFDGRGHKIKYRADSEEMDGGYYYLKGLFSILDTGGVIKNLSVDAYIRRFNWAGAVAAFNAGGEIYNCSVSADIMYGGDAGGVTAINRGLVDDCHVSLSVLTEKGEDNGSLTLGGIVSSNGHGTQAAKGIYSGTIRNCSFKGIIDFYRKSGFAARLGGITAQIANDSVIEGCEAEGKILAHTDGYSDTNKTDVYAGGIVGTGKGKITNCKFSGELAGRHIGGIIGQSGASGIFISNCFTDIRAGISKWTGSINVGGIIGNAPNVSAAANSLIVENCRATGSITFDEEKSGYAAYMRLGGIVGTIDSKITLRNCVSSVDISGTIGDNMTALGALGGIIGRFTGASGSAGRNITNNVYLGNLSLTTKPTLGADIKYYAGGIIGLDTSVNDKISNNVSLGRITVTKEDHTKGNTFGGGLFGGLGAAYANIAGNNWLASAGHNDGLYFAGEVGGAAVTSETIAGTNTSLASENLFAPTAAILEPNLYALGLYEVPKELNVTVYPEGAQKAENIAGVWTWNEEGAVSAATDGLKAAISPAALGDAVVSFDVTLDPDTPGNNLQGNAAPRLTAYLRVVDSARITGVTPSGQKRPAAGSVTVTFSEPMSTSAGSISLARGESAVSLSAGEWSAGGTVYAAPYSGLADSAEYGIRISGFADASGRELAPDNNHKFRTAAADDIITGVAFIDGVQSVSFEDGDVEWNVNPGKITDETNLYEINAGLSAIVEVDIDTGDAALRTDVVESVVNEDEALKELVDLNENTLALPVFEAQVLEPGKTAFVTFEVNLSPFSGKRIGDLTLLKFKPDGTAEPLPPAPSVAGISAGQYIFTDKYGGRTDEQTVIPRENPIYYLSVAIEDNGEQDWEQTAELNSVVDPLVITVSSHALFVDTSVTRIWTTVGPDVYEANQNGLILVPDYAQIDDLPIWITPKNKTASVSPEASGLAYDFTEPRKFTVTAEDGVTTQEYEITVKADPDDTGTQTGSIVKNSDLKEWATSFTHYKDGTVRVEMTIPITGLFTGIPQAITAETTGLKASSYYFYLTDADGNPVKNYLSGLESAAQNHIPAFLHFSANSTEEEYKNAKLLSFIYWLPDDETPYEQALAGASGSGVALYSETTVTDNVPVNDKVSGGGGCDAGTAASFVLMIGAAATVLRKKKER